jgi:diguanylate cyclase (GGDEF)-like protein
VRLPAASLTSQIVTLVFAATVATALAVTWVSVSAIHGFLSVQIDEKFPQLLHGAAERLELWYSQVRVEVDTFARSETVEKNLAALRRGGGERRAQNEVEAYLGYVLERFDQYSALFILDEKGQILLWVGEERELPPTLRSRLARYSAARVGDVIQVGEEQIQIASAPVSGSGRHATGSLHALLDLDALDRLLGANDPGPEGRLFLVRSDGRYLRDPSPRSRGRTYGRAIPEPGEAPRVEDYRTRGGREVVGAAVSTAPFDWAIVVEVPYDAAFEPIYDVVWSVLLLNLGIVCVFGLVSLRLAVSLTRPIKALSEGAQRVANGEVGVEIPDARSDDEIGLLTRTFNEMTERLHQHQLELHQKSDELELLSVTDELTGVYNHRYFREQLQIEIKRAGRIGRLLALVLIDIDDFKRLNDTWGHAAGDEVLRGVARVMSREIRDTDVLARYGGEEFALVTLQDDLSGAVVMAEKLRAAVSDARFEIETDEGPRWVRITISIGVSSYSGDARAFFNDADRALYRAKEAGKDCVCS